MISACYVHILSTLCFTSLYCKPTTTLKTICQCHSSVHLWENRTRELSLFSLSRSLCDKLAYYSSWMYRSVPQLKLFSFDVDSYHSDFYASLSHKLRESENNDSSRVLFSHKCKDEWHWCTVLSVVVGLQYNDVKQIRERMCTQHALLVMNVFVVAI